MELEGLGSVLFCSLSVSVSVSVWLDAGLFKNTVIRTPVVLGGPGGPGGPGQLVKKIDDAPFNIRL